MKKAALVIRTCGDIELTSTIAKTFESPELKRLRAQIGVTESARSKQYKKMIKDARRKYKTKPMSPFRQKIWGLIGLAILYSHGG